MQMKAILVDPAAARVGILRQCHFLINQCRSAAFTQHADAEKSSFYIAATESRATLALPW